MLHPAPPTNQHSITLFEQGPHGKLVGEDVNGNRYYENNDLPYGAFGLEHVSSSTRPRPRPRSPPPATPNPPDRKRWVVYKERTPPYKPNPTSIPPEWHGWINYINDFEPGNHKVRK